MVKFSKLVNALKETVREVNETHAELVMVTDPSSRAAFHFQSNTIVNNFHISVKRAIEAVLGYPEAESVESPPSHTSTDSSSTVSSTVGTSPSRISYLEKTKLLMFCDSVAK